MNELYKKRRGTSQMSEQFGPNFAPGSFALRGPYDWSTRSDYPEAQTSQPGQRGTTRMHRHRKSTHTFGNGDTTQQPARDSAATATTAAADASDVVLLLLLLCCCLAAAVLLLRRLCCAAAAAAAVLLLLSHTGTSSPCS